MNTERLYEFLVLSHVLNYTRAAKALYISQPILTRHIQAELGVRSSAARPTALR